MAHTLSIIPGEIIPMMEKKIKTFFFIPYNSCKSIIIVKLIYMDGWFLLIFRFSSVLGDFGGGWFEAESLLSLFAVILLRGLGEVAG